MTRVARPEADRVAEALIDEDDDGTGAADAVLRDVVDEVELAVSVDDTELRPLTVSEALADIDAVDVAKAEGVAEDLPEDEGVRVEPAVDELRRRARGG
jgi:hypothetical protein